MKHMSCLLEYFRVIINITCRSAFPQSMGIVNECVGRKTAAILGLEITQSHETAICSNCDLAENRAFNVFRCVCFNAERDDWSYLCSAGKQTQELCYIKRAAITRANTVCELHPLYLTKNIQKKTHSHTKQNVGPRSQ